MEATLHLAHAGMEYHRPRLFLLHLNATIQALRNITFKVQAEKKRIPDFATWYQQEQTRMRSDDLLQRFHDARNKVVHEAGVRAKSSFRSGMFRGRRMKLALVLNLPLMVDSEDELKRLQASSFAASILDPDRSAIGEQLGVERTWIVEGLGEEEVLSLSTAALNNLSALVSRAHAQVGSAYRCEPLIYDEHDRGEVQVLLETDLDPSLSKKWGWDDAAVSIHEFLKRNRRSENS